MEYKLELINTTETTGFFAATPIKELSLTECLNYLLKHPLDTFMRKHIIHKLGSLTIEEIKKKLQSFSPLPLPLQSLAYELSLLSPKFKKLEKFFPSTDLKSLQQHTPLIISRVLSKPAQSLHQQWLKIFEQNLIHHQPLPLREKINLPSPIKLNPINPQVSSLAKIHSQIAVKSFSPTPLPSSYELAKKAYKILQSKNIFASIEMRHQSSLSPIGLLRQWKLMRQVNTPSLNYSLNSLQTSYGRGFNLDQARVGLYMEIVERFSSFASIKDNQVLDLKESKPIYIGTYSNLKKQGLNCLSPQKLGLDFTYQEEPLHWIYGEQVLRPEQREKILVPLQVVYLFSNLDEIDLFDGLGSTGLAAGATLAQAKLAALLEVIERDSEALGFYLPQKCFRLNPQKSASTPFTRLLSKLEQAGIQVTFQDLTTELGIPCYKAFVETLEGEIFKGTGANLDAQKALVAALTEVPYPFPHGPKTQNWPANLKEKTLEEFPNYCLGSIEANLYQLEYLLTANGYHPIYVNLTRQDIGLPVVKAIIPGFESLLSFDETTTIKPRMWEQYLKLSKKDLIE